MLVFSPLLIFRLFLCFFLIFFSQEIGVLRQQILASEGELRNVSSPAYTAKDRDKAMAEQSVSFYFDNFTILHFDLSLFFLIDLLSIHVVVL